MTISAPFWDFGPSGDYDPVAEASHEEIETVYRAQKLRGAKPKHWVKQLSRLLKERNVSRYAHLKGGADRVLVDILDGLESVMPSPVRILPSALLRKRYKEAGIESGAVRLANGKERAQWIRSQFPSRHSALSIAKAWALTSAKVNTPNYRKQVRSTTILLRRHNVAQ